MTVFYGFYRPEDAQHIFVGVYPHHIDFPPANENTPVSRKHRPDTQEWTVRILNPVVAAAKGKDGFVGIFAGEPHADLKVRSSSLCKVVWGRFRGVDHRYGNAARIFLQALASSAVAKVQRVAELTPDLVPIYRERLDRFLAAVNAALDQLSET